MLIIMIALATLAGMQHLLPAPLAGLQQHLLSAQ
jgi:hypothetical protein